jgi:hypothetical protein
MLTICLLTENWTELNHSSGLFEVQKLNRFCYVTRQFGHSSACKTYENVQGVTKFWKHSLSVSLFIFRFVKIYPAKLDYTMQDNADHNGRKV